MINVPQTFVEVVKKNVEAMEKEVNKKEAEYSTLNSIKKTFRKFPFIYFGKVIIA